ncbi:family 1 glycosylhydrolase [Paenibacillus sp. FSL W8-0426]|uniref:glycoside hydrolase family 1 protein n=1 Tax=Paenibacillus sp. FSL W8-0426 TaxID=2921714 RepID=UPI0030DC61DD
MTKPFRSDFMLGAATAAHQVEGNNIHSDFWAMEHMPHSLYKEPSLQAVDHYHFYEKDIQMLVDAGLNTYRFSIEWARIEPVKGQFAAEEIEHYRKVLECCHQHKVNPVVTLHHFSSPKWLIAEGGWESKTTVEHFKNYCRHVVSELGPLMPYICTINEANMGKQITKIMKRMIGAAANDSNSTTPADVQVGLNVDVQSSMEKYFASLGQVFGMDPTKVQPFLSPRTEQGEQIIMKCHQAARSVIKELNSSIKVGITLSLYDHQALPGGEQLAEQEQHEDFLYYLPFLQGDDFIGVQNYSRKIHGPSGVVQPPDHAKLTKMGYENYPQALANVLQFVAKHWDGPIIVTENGISTDQDDERVEFIRQATAGVQKCVEDGIDVIGYMYWSLLDNFEWQLGYAQTFGLIAVDRSTQIRTPKESLSFLGSLRNR